MKPTLNEEQKRILVYDLLSWALTISPIMSADTPKADIFRLIHVIVNDSTAPMGASSNELLIKELRKTGVLWHQMRPFLKNRNEIGVARLPKLPRGC